MSLINQNKFLLFIMFLMLLVKPSNSLIDWRHEYEITRNFSEALKEIVNTLFVDTYKRRVFNFQIEFQPRNKKYSHMFHSIVDKTAHLLKDHISMRLNNGLTIPADNERHFAVILVDSGKSLEFLYKDLNKFHLFVEGSYFIILLTYPNTHHYYDELYEIFNLNWRVGITHANVLIHAVDNNIIMFHSVPFNRFHCKGIAPIIHNKFVDGRWLHKKFFVPKAANLYGCSLVCATWEDLPYFKVDRKSIKGKSKYEGLEGKLLEYLSEKMNFTITMRWLNDDEINQTIFDEDGIFNKLFSSGTDFVIGAFHYQPTSLEVQYTPTTAYYMSDYVFVVSSRTDAYDPFTKLLLPFDIDIWIILIFIFIFGNIAVFMVIYLDRNVTYYLLGRDNVTPTYNMLIISLGGAVTKDPKIPFSRFLLMLWLLATFVLRSVYQGFMYHFIRSDLHRPPPNQIHDLFQPEYCILVSEMVYTAISDLPHLYGQVELLNVSEVEAFEMLRHPEDYMPNKLAIVTALEYFGYYKLFTPVNLDFYIVPEKLFTQQLSIYMKKNSAYLQSFNMYIKTYIDIGLMSRWERLLLFTNAAHKRYNESPKATKMSHLLGVFNLLLIGLAMSLMIFLMEIFVCAAKKIYRRLRRKWRKMMKMRRRNRFLL